MKVAHGQELLKQTNKAVSSRGVDNFHISARQPRRIARLSILSRLEESPIYQSGPGQLPSEDRDPVDVWIPNLLLVCSGWSLVGWQRHRSGFCGRLVGRARPRTLASFKASGRLPSNISP